MPTERGVVASAPRALPVVFLAAVAVAAAGCGVVRSGEPGEVACPSFDDTVKPMLGNECGACHVRQLKGGYSVASWGDALARRPDGSFRVTAGDAQSLLLQAARGELAGHEKLSEGRVELLTEWVVRCKAAPRQGKYHEPGWATPSDAERFHGLALRDAGYQPLFTHGTGEESKTCLDCHGDDLLGGKSGESCSTCHAKGPLDCSTCHGDATSAAPPRSLSGQSLTSTVGVGAHRTHVLDGGVGRPIACEACHPAVKNFMDDGHVFVGGVFDGSRVARVALQSRPDAGVTASWDRASATCTNTTCHAPLPGDTAATNQKPHWIDVGVGQAKCGSCHGLPPSNHKDGRCELCHDLGYADGGVVASLHLNGSVDFRGPQCDTCHAGPATVPFHDLLGRTDAKLPTVGAHEAHLRSSRYRGPLACDECHTVPSKVTDPGHIDATPGRVFVAKPAAGGLAWTDGATPAYDPSTGKCSNVYCHGGGTKLGADQAGFLVRSPAWTGAETQGACGSCHALPPVDGRAEHDGGTVLGCVACHAKSITATGKLVFTTGADGGLVSTHLDGLVTGN